MCRGLIECVRHVNEGVNEGDVNEGGRAGVGVLVSGYCSINKCRSEVVEKVRVRDVRR